jgi:hypothetical protein
MRTEIEAPLVERAASAAVGAALGIAVGIAFELLRIFFADATEISLTSIAIFCAFGALAAAFAQRAVLFGVAACVSFFGGVVSALTPEYWVVRGQSPVDWPRWTLLSFGIGFAVVVVVALLA